MKQGATKTSSHTPWLQHAVAVGAAVHTLRVARRLGRVDYALRSQEKAFAKLVDRISRTAFGLHAGIESGMDYANFARRISLHTYEELGPWIERMKRGESDVLWPGSCALYAVSSGTTAGRTKYLPITTEMLGHFRRTGLDSLCLYARRVRSTAVFRGRHLFLGGSTSLTPIAESHPFKAQAGDLSGITAVHLPRWAERHLYEPGREIAQLDDWPEKLRAIAERTATRNVTLLAGIPSWILIFAEELKAQSQCPNLRAVWPGLECLIHGGVPVAPFAGALREVLGPEVNWHEVYPASEGFIAAQDESATAGLRLFADAGIFYEFLPMTQFDASRLGEVGKFAVPLSAVRCDVDYALVMTTPAGLCRYVIGDIVRFVSTDPARLVYVGRTALQLSAFGEHVIEKELTDALAAWCAHTGATVRNFHVAPLFADPTAARMRGSHEWWIELDEASPNVDPGIASDVLDNVMRRLNDDYAAKRAGGGLNAPEVRLVAHGTFERWLRGCGKWGGQHKMPRCRSDREIADRLAAIVAEARLQH